MRSFIKVKTSNGTYAMLDAERILMVDEVTYGVCEIHLADTDQVFQVVGDKESIVASFDSAHSASDVPRTSHHLGEVSTHALLQEMPMTAKATTAGRPREKMFEGKTSQEVQELIHSRHAARLYSIHHGKASDIMAKKYLGCTCAEFTKYIESKWAKGMNWGNYGKWQYCRMLPYSAVDLTDPAELAKVAHFTNIMPMWREDVHVKCGRLPEEWERYVETYGLPSDTVLTTTTSAAEFIQTYIKNGRG